VRPCRGWRQPATATCRHAPPSQLNGVYTKTASVGSGITSRRLLAVCRGSSSLACAGRSVHAQAPGLSSARTYATHQVGVAARHAYASTPRGEMHAHERHDAPAHGFLRQFRSVLGAHHCPHIATSLELAIQFLEVWARNAHRIPGVMFAFLFCKITPRDTDPPPWNDPFLLSLPPPPLRSLAPWALPQSAWRPLLAPTCNLETLNPKPKGRDLKPEILNPIP